MNCTVWLWSGMALNIWVCSQDKMCPTVMCLSGYIVYIYAIMHTATYVTCEYIASGPTQLSVACSGVKWEVAYCTAETFKGENSRKF